MSSQRLKSVDVFRGATIVAMILVNAQFSHDESYRQFAHAAWNGWTFADTIFPSFLFIVGVSIPLSISARLERGQDHASLLRHALRRSILLFGLGLMIDYFRFPSHTFPFFGVQDHLQLTGALQKIAVCYLAASQIYLWAGLRGAVVAAIGLNLLYLGLLYSYPVPGCEPGLLAVNCNFPGYLDHLMLGRFRWNSSAFDPDGLGTVLPAITSVLFGVLAGELIHRERGRRRIFLLLAGGLFLIAAGQLLAIWVPINKQLWTTSFAVFMAGLSALGLACTIWLIDERSLRTWYKPLGILGRNAIAAYLLSRLVANVPRVHIAGKSLYADVLVPTMSPSNASMLFAILVLAAVYLMVSDADRRGWHLNL